MKRYLAILITLIFVFASGTVLATQPDENPAGNHSGEGQGHERHGNGNGYGHHKDIVDEEPPELPDVNDAYAAAWVEGTDGIGIGFSFGDNSNGGFGRAETLNGYFASTVDEDGNWYYNYRNANASGFSTSRANMDGYSYDYEGYDYYGYNEGCYNDCDVYLPGFSGRYSDNDRSYIWGNIQSNAGTAVYPDGLNSAFVSGEFEVVNWAFSSDTLLGLEDELLGDAYAAGGNRVLGGYDGFAEVEGDKLCIDGSAYGYGSTDTHAITVPGLAASRAYTYGNSAAYLSPNATGLAYVDGNGGIATGALAINSGEGWGGYAQGQSTANYAYSSAGTMYANGGGQAAGASFGQVSGYNYGQGGSVSAISSTWSNSSAWSNGYHPVDNN